jgi:general secretion pathway protein K
LISVLWVLLLLSSLAAVASYTARTNALLTHRALEIAQARAAADAAIVNTLSELSDEQIARHPMLGSSQPWVFDGVNVAVFVSNEAGRIDVNRADRDLLFAFLRSQGVDDGTAEIMMSQLRESNAIPFKQGNGLTYAHPDAPLQTVEELRRLPAWRAQNLDCWFNSLTVYTGLPGISPADATARGLQALQWAQAHRLGDRDWIAGSATASGALADRSILGEVLRLEATSTVSADVRATSIWVGRLTGDRKNPMLTMRWAHSDSGGRSSCNDEVLSTAP